MPNNAAEQHLNELTEITLYDESEHIEPPEHWDLEDFQDLLG